MIYLLKLEWIKFGKSSIFLIMGLLFLLLLPSISLLGRSIFIGAPGLRADAVLEFPIVWSYVGYIGNWLTFFFFGFFAIYIFTSEFSNRTYRQNIISGISRTNLYLAKVIFLATIAIVAAIYFAIICIVLGLISSESASYTTAWDRFYLAPHFFLMCLGYMSLGVLSSIIIRRTAVSVFFYFVYILFFEVIFRWWIHKSILDNFTMNLYPANAFEDLLPMPLNDWSMTSQLTQGDQTLAFLTPIQASTTSIIYIIIIFACGLYLTNKRDL